MQEEELFEMSQTDFENKVDSFHNSQKNVQSASNIGIDSAERKKAGHKGLFQVKGNDPLLPKQTIGNRNNANVMNQSSPLKFSIT